MIPAQTMSSGKMFSPTHDLLYTSGEKQNGVRKMNEKIKTKTSGPQKIIGYKTLCKFDYT